MQQKPVLLIISLKQSDTSTDAHVCCCTFNPRSSSLSERRISDVSPFIRSHSWKATITYGVLSSGGTLDIISCMENGSGRLPTMSSRIDLIYT